MKLLIIGATRGIGKALLETALEEEFDVTVLAREPARLGLERSGLRIVKGDVENSGSVIEAAEGQDAICSCIGVPITFQPVRLFSKAAANLVAAVKKNPGQKCVVVTGIGAGDSSGHGGFLYDRIFKPLFLKTIYADKDREEEIIKRSGVDWLIVRPAGLTNGPRTGKYKVYNDLSGVVSKRISRLDVADFIIKQLKNPEHFGKTPLISY
jgi:putative NADH-flavin reductase